MSPFEKWAVRLTSGLTALTGFVYLWMKYLMSPSEPWSVINHPLQPLVLKLHIVVAPLMVFTLGVVTLRHIWTHYVTNMRAGRRSGLTTALVAGPMIVSGYLIQIFTSVAILRALALIHIVVGTLYVVGLIIHQIVLRNRDADEVSGGEEGRRRGTPRMTSERRFRAPAD